MKAGSDSDAVTASGARQTAWVLALTAGGLLVFASAWIGWRTWGDWDDAQWFTVIGTAFLVAAAAAERRVRPAKGPAMRRRAAAAALVVGALMASGIVSAQDAERTELDRLGELAAAQESLLNAYRCMLGVDMELAPGGCDPHRVSAPALAVSGVGQAIRYADLRDGRYVVEASATSPPGGLEGDDGGFYFSARLLDLEGFCEWLPAAIVREPVWVEASVIVLGGHGGCDPGDPLIIKVSAPEGIAWQITFTPR